MSKHTPGPWQARFIYRMIKAARQSPGLLFSAPPENDWGDATLMAASPRMVAACKKALGWFKSETALEEIEDVINILKDAIKEAEPDEQSSLPEGFGRFLDALGDHFERTDPEWCKETSKKLETFEEWMARRNSEGLES